MTGGNAEAVPDRKGKRKNEDKTADEAKKVKFSALTSEPRASTSGASTSGKQFSSPSAKDSMKKKSLLGQLLTEKVDAGRGFGLFD
jgi:hypothetical protein